MTALPVPTLADVLAARRRITPHLPATPLVNYPTLDHLLGCTAYVKHENQQPVGAFKVRGGVNLALRLDDASRDAGLVAASTGNHAQSVAYGGRLAGAPVTIIMPEGANPAKVAATQALGADVRHHGDSFVAACAYADAHAKETGKRYVHSGDEPDLVTGVATYVVEMLEAAPDIDTIIVPVGGGSGAAGCCIAAKAIRPDIEVIGVQAATAPSAYRSWKEGRPVPVPSETIAEGLATGEPFEYPQSILRAHLDDFVLVGDQAMVAGVRTYLDHTRNLVEHAGAASLAAVTSDPERFRGRNVGLVLSGGNLTVAQLRDVLDQTGDP